MKSPLPDHWTRDEYRPNWAIDHDQAMRGDSAAEYGPESAAQESAARRDLSIATPE
jgi:hypothetical protein